MRMQGRILNEEELIRIHKDSIRILEEVGIKFPSQEALSLLESRGAKVDWDRQIAYIPEASGQSRASDCTQGICDGRKKSGNGPGAAVKPGPFTTWTAAASIPLTLKPARGVPPSFRTWRILRGFSKKSASATSIGLRFRRATCRTNPGA